MTKFSIPGKFIKMAMLSWDSVAMVEQLRSIPLLSFSFIFSYHNHCVNVGNNFRNFMNYCCNNLYKRDYEAVNRGLAKERIENLQYEFLFKLMQFVFLIAS